MSCVWVVYITELIKMSSRMDAWNENITVSLISISFVEAGGCVVH